MKQIDVVVIGGGVPGCFAARSLRRWQISTLLIEKEEDICLGITRANSAIVYAGYDNRPGSLKAEMTVRGNANMEALCRELEVPFSRCGSLLVTYEETAVSRLEKKLENGRQNGVPGLRLITGPEAEVMEPMLKKGVVAALYAPSTGTVNPWQLGIAAWENAMKNGAETWRNTEVQGIVREKDGYILQTSRESVACKMVLNCAGASADKVQELAFAPTVRLRLDGAEYLVLDSQAEKPSRVIFHQARRCGKGITAIPYTEGNLLISGIRKPLKGHYATSYSGVEELHQAARALLPELDLSKVIRSFGAVRPNPYLDAGGNLPDFCIEHPAPGFYSLIGVKTPGLTCAGELGMYLARAAADDLNAAENPAFDPRRKAITEKDYEIICRCELVTKAQVLEAIRRVATTVDGVKRRVGAGMGRCQGSRCGWRIAQLLKETGANPDPLF